MDMVDELRRKSKQATPSHPYVRVRGEFLAEVANEMERLQRIEQSQIDRLLFTDEARVFGETGLQTRAGQRESR